MSEYWKSTPSYWCKHCKQYVKDTKLEKSNHEASPRRHQGNLKRFLRDLHRGQEKGAKRERQSERRDRATKWNTTAAQRKEQLAQLAELGVSVPDEFRSDLAMAGEWQVTSERIIDDGSGEKKPDALALGVRKREVEDEDEEAKEAKKEKMGTTKGKGPGLKSETVDAVKIEIKKENDEVTETPSSNEGKEPAVKSETEDDCVQCPYLQPAKGGVHTVKVYYVGPPETNPPPIAPVNSCIISLLAFKSHPSPPTISLMGRENAGHVYTCK
ncbi:hypothetical protein EYC84_006895 [Monilinia fructicola]|uniref:U1-type domain-containing protein n=1 Tax=Monilinia fructicola TaxID=38448 RepID=A0A5M9K8M9_MONFR|nr:hypothetical protein EYC84_006895 [Monilinia fructicola]